MPIVVVVGGQWGDEGKGRIVDLLARKARVVARYSAGNNAGHTIVNDRGATKAKAASSISSPAKRVLSRGTLLATTPATPS